MIDCSNHLDCTRERSTGAGAGLDPDFSISARLLITVPQSAQFQQRSSGVGRPFSAAIIVVSTIVLGAARVDGQADATCHEKEIVSEPPARSAWSGEAGFNFVTAYFADGFLAENQGVIAQPYFDLYYTLHEGDGVISRVTIGSQVWSSIHSEKTDAQPDTAVPQWYEFDYFLPLAVTFAKRATLTLSYFEYQFPNGAFAASRGIEANFAYDDVDVLGAFALHPHATSRYTFDGVMRFGRTGGWYEEFGIAPGFSIAPKSKYELAITFPITVGVGDDHFYPGNAYGFFSATINGSVPLAFLPKSFGAWTLNAGFTYYNLGAATAAINSNGDHNAYVGQAGIEFTF
jgi:hypothetical protein